MALPSRGEFRNERTPTSFPIGPLTYTRRNHPVITSEKMEDDGDLRGDPSRSSRKRFSDQLREFAVVAITLVGADDGRDRDSAEISLYLYLSLSLISPVSTLLHPSSSNFLRRASSSLGVDLFSSLIASGL